MLKQWRQTGAGSVAKANSQQLICHGPEWHKLLTQLAILQLWKQQYDKTDVCPLKQVLKGC
jgi:hypothetical protein